VFVAEYTASGVAEVDLDSGKVIRQLNVPLPPTGLALDSPRNLLYVTGEAPEGSVTVLNLKTGAVSSTLSAGHTPVAPVLSPDGKTLFVCNRFNNNVALYDVASGRELTRIPMIREPIAAAMTPDGKILVVANHLPNMPANKDVVAAAVSLIDTGTRTVVAQLLLPNGSSSLRGVCVSPDGKFAYVTHILGHFQLPTTQLERGWMNTSALSIIDLGTRKIVTTVLLDDVDLGAANPWGVACSADGAWIYVAHAGTHEVSAINRTALHGKLEALAAGKKSGFSATLEDVTSDLSFLVDLRQRIKLPGNGPRGLVVAGPRVVVSQYFSGDLAVVRPEAPGFSKVQMIPLGPQVPLTTVRQGEIFFHDAQLCFQHWQSCSSCHPDSRVDALNWDLLNDGIGNPKNTRTMVYTHRMMPVMSLGKRDTAEAAVRSGLKFIQFCVRPEEDAIALDAYLKSLTPVPSPKLIKGSFSPAAERGKALFLKVGCTNCHSGPLFTDMKSHDVGTSDGIDKGKAFVTPRWVEVWRTAPYLHDGSALTVKEAFQRCSGKIAAGLKPQEQDDLAEFVLSN
jgi:DNA-binding beta-propeller fold protein YncE